VLPSLHTGGMERFVVLLGTELVRRGHRATVVCTQFEGDLAESARRHRIEVVLSPFQSRWDNLWPIGLTRDLRCISPDLVHSQNGVWLPAALSAVWLGLPMCHTEHGLDSPTEPLKVASQKFVAARFTDAVVAVSSPLEHRLAAQYLISRKRLSRIDNGIPTEQFAPQADIRTAVRSELGISDETILIGAVARLHHLKGIDLLMEAARSLDVGDQPVCIVVAGDGEDRSRVEELAKQSAVPVQLVGMRSDVNRLMQAFDVFVLPSRSEGLPLAVLEAMAAGCAIVATDVGEVAEVLANDSGVVVAPHDVKALSDAIARLVADQALRSRISANALCKVRQRYGIDRMTDSYLRLYNQLLAAPSSN
jgi:glycosyltransferase involved in cell wall biosynthesis